jgi:hypothetical protein
MGGNASVGWTRGVMVVAIFVIGLLAAGPPAAAQQKMSRAAFCTAYAQVCQQTCPQGVGNCGAVCGPRLEACRASGCFHFNVPRARCDSNPDDIALLRQPTDARPKASRVTFCSAWAQVCQRTCPQGPGNCGAFCGQHLDACRSTGCFHFNNPRPRCDSNPKDVALSRQPPPR